MFSALILLSILVARTTRASFTPEAELFQPEQRMRQVGSRFGFSVAMSSSVLAVGMPGSSGRHWTRVFVWQRVSPTANWSFVQILGPFQAAILSSDLYGFSVDINADDTIVVGAPWWSSSTTNLNVGTTWIYRRPAGYKWWLNEKRIGLGGNLTPFKKDLVGYSVTIYGNLMMAGAPGRENNRGGVFGFSNVRGTWERWWYDYDPNGKPGDQFGVSVDLFEETLVVGTMIGVAYVWERYSHPTLFLRLRETQKFTSTVPNDNFGMVVKIDGSTIAIGSRGAVYIYERVGGNFTRHATIIANDTRPGDGFGTVISLSGGLLAVGAPNINAVYIFRRYGAGLNSTWRESQKLNGFNRTGSGDMFGGSVSVHGGNLVVGVPSSDVNQTDTGLAFVFHGASQTFSPTSFPTKNPTAEPTQPPSKFPSTSSPTSNPTRSPTKYPTQKPTKTPVTSSPTFAAAQRQQPWINQVIFDSKVWLLVGLLSLLAMMCVIGKIHAKCSNTTVFHLGSAVLFSFYTYDFMTDVLFAYSLLIARSVLSFVLCMISISFIILPLISSMYAWHSQKVWWGSKDREFHAMFMEYQDRFEKSFILLSMISGSTFGALELTNSGLFGLGVFEMNLPNYAKNEFRIQRGFLTVACENIPQFVVQLIWLFASPSNTPQAITFAALTTSVFSIIAALYGSFSKQLRLAATARYLCTFDLLIDLSNGTNDISLHPTTAQIVLFEILSNTHHITANGILTDVLVYGNDSWFQCFFYFETGKRINDDETNKLLRELLQDDKVLENIRSGLDVESVCAKNIRVSVLSTKTTASNAESAPWIQRVHSAIPLNDLRMLTKTASEQTIVEEEGEVEGAQGEGRERAYTREI